MGLTIIKKTAIHKVFTAMIGFFLVALILFVAQRYLVAAVCLIVFCLLFWKWRLLLSEALLLALLAQNAGRMGYSELVDRFSKQKADQAIARLVKKALIERNQQTITLMPSKESRHMQNRRES